MTDDIRRRVVCAAIRSEDDGLVICSVRHFDTLMRAAIEKLGRNPANSCWEQGFVTNRGEFISREEGWMLATARGQVLRVVGNQKSATEDGHDLYSENLY